MRSADDTVQNNELLDQPAGPSIIVIFGAAGDLTKRLLLPALYNLARSNLLPKEFAIVGVARASMNTDDFRSKIGRDIQEFATVPVDAQLWEWFEQRLYYLQGEFQDANTYSQLQDLLVQVDSECGTRGNYLYYLATASNFFCDKISQLGAVGLTQEENGHWRRVIIEKPFGHDLDSARALNKNISSVLPESQVYRIDHYLGKETGKTSWSSDLGMGYLSQFGTITMLYDCMIGEATLFQRSDNVELGWSVVTPILDVWKALPPRIPNYAAGTWRPLAADDLLERDGRQWRTPE